MPKMNGLEMTRHIRREDRDVHIIAFTAFNELSLLHDALEFGINHYLVKPFDGELFFSVLKQSIDEISQREERDSKLKLLTSAVENSSSLIAIYDQELTLTYANPYLFKITGLEPNEVIGKPINAIIKSAEERPFIAVDDIKSILRDQMAWTGVLPMRHHDSSISWVSASISLIEGDDRRPRYFVKVGEDITERLRFEELLKRRDRIMKAVAEVANVFLNKSQWRYKLKEIFADIGEATSSEHICLFQASDSSHRVYSVQDEWYRDAFIPFPEIDLSSTNRSWDLDQDEALKRVLEGGETYVADSNTLPAGLLGCLTTAMKTVCLVPIKVDGALWGVMCFSSVERNRELSSLEQEALFTFANIIGSAFHQERVFEALHQSEGELERIVDAVQLGTWEWDREAQQLSHNELFATIHHLQGSESAYNLSDFINNIHPHDRRMVKKRLVKIIKAKIPSRFVLQYRVKGLGQGGKWVETVGDVANYNKSMAAAKISGISYDIDDRKRSELKLLQTAKIFTATKEAISITDSERKIIDVNSAFEEITGYSKKEAIGKDHSILKSYKMPTTFYDKMYRELAEKGTWQGEVTNRRKDGRLFPAWLTASAVTDANGYVTNYVAVFSDISKIKQQQERVEYLATHDPLTDLPNRSMLKSVLDHSIKQAKRRNKKIALFFIDLDGFKYINDTYGHNVGDEVLVELANRLKKELRSEDFICRLGGDEFLVLLDGTDTIEYLNTVTQKILSVYKKPFHIGSHDFIMTGSIGISIFPDDSSDPDMMIQHADIAMYQAKENGKNTFRVYQSPMGEAVSQHLMMQTEIQKALDRKEFELHYQPQIDIITGELIGLECLVRWRHGDKGLISPAKFIPLAEETRQIIPLGEHILREGCMFIKGLIDKNVFSGRLAINVSTVQLEEEDQFFSALENMLNNTGFDPCHLEIEITETFVMKNPGRSYRILNKIKELGITIAMDDFGTGYSSLSSLSKFPIDLIKIDKSFIDEVPDKEDDVAITKTVIALAHNLKIPVIAEGVENKSQHEFLKKEGCQFG